MSDPSQPIPSVSSASESGAPVTEPRGAVFKPAYVERGVKVFGVLESEVHTIAMFNTLSTAFFSVGSGLFSLAAGVLVNSAFAEKLTPAGEVLAKFVAPGLCLLAVVFILLAVWAAHSRVSTWDEIRKESKPAVAMPVTKPLIPDTPDSSRPIA